MSTYIPLDELEVYRFGRKLSDIAWRLYEGFDWETKKIMGDQYVRATDSVGANIAEGYSRYHYLDRIKFYYNARASLMEACNHWLELLYVRKKINEENFYEYKKISEQLSIKLNNFIRSSYNAKNNQSL